jgi:site-specific recombinase XerD
MANPRRLTHGRGVSWEITYRVVRQRLPTLVRAGLATSYGMHALRHTYASGLIAEALHG